MKFFYGIVAVVLLGIAIALPAFKNWVISISSMISKLNVGFFAVMPWWFNLLFSTLVIYLIITLVNSFRK